MNSKTFSGDALATALKKYVLQPLQDPRHNDALLSCVETPREYFYSVRITRVTEYTEQAGVLTSITFEASPLLRRPQVFSWGITSSSDTLLVASIDVSEIIPETVNA